jgi:hypothetical protein
MTDMIRQFDNSVSLGDNLIFLISQPRSGSTLLQHIIASHPQVYTTAEPWLLLPLLYRPTTGVEHSLQLAYAALDEFLALLPEGEALYREQVRKMALALYGHALVDTGKKYFLDKTPRYYLIIPELAQLFPAARFILLVRNPLAVLLSILSYHHGSDWKGLARPGTVLDLCEAPRLMLQGMRVLGDRAVVVHYESLIQSPEREVREVCEHIGLNFCAEMIEYGDKVKLSGTFVDKKSIYKHNKPVSDYADQWREGFVSSQSQRFAREYLESLGPELVSQLGYSFDELLQTLPSPSFIRNLFTVPWQQLLRPPFQMRWWERLWLALAIPHKKAGLKTLIKSYGQALFGC